MENFWCEGYHLRPPRGWLNDPNGLCYFAGEYHVFHQYSPDWPKADAARGWGHYSSVDLVDWRHHGMVIKPGLAFEANGAYSGSAVVLPSADKDVLHLYYTGNVKHPGDFDYIYNGREANQVLIEVDSAGDIAEATKQLILQEKDYPATLSQHVRDPKVWRDDERWWMLLGARDLESRGLALLYTSQNGRVWDLHCKLESAEPFGYMWECPDRIEIAGKEFLVFCPQGMEQYPWSFGLRDQSGYVPLGEGEKLSDAPIVDQSAFTKWDYGFEFYAPQTFTDPKGRILLIGWLGLPIAPYESAPAQAPWCHCLTVLREVQMNARGKLVQRPVDELKQLRTERIAADVKVDAWSAESASHLVDLEITDLTGNFSLTLDAGLELSYRDQTLELAFSDVELGLGRTVRSVHCSMLSRLRILIDNSALEIFVDDGEIVFSNRWFPLSQEKLKIEFKGTSSDPAIWQMRSIY